MTVHCQVLVVSSNMYVMYVRVYVYRDVHVCAGSCVRVYVYVTVVGLYVHMQHVYGMHMYDMPLDLTELIRSSSHATASRPI